MRIINKLIMFKSKGITLIEIIVVTAILIIATLIITTTFITLWRVSQMHLSSFEAKSQSSIALQKISELIEEAISVLPERVINSTSYATTENTLVLKLPSITSDGEIVPANFDYAAISIATSTKLIADIEPSAESARPRGQIILSNLAKNLNFRYNSSTSTEITTVEVFLEMDTSTYNLEKTSVLWTIAKLRNK